MPKQITEIISPKIYLLLCRPVRMSVSRQHVVVQDRIHFEIKVPLHNCLTNTTRTSFHVDTGPTCHVRSPVTTLQYVMFHWSCKLSDVTTYDIFLWRCGPNRAMASSFLRLLDHTQRRTTVGRTPLDE